MRKNSLWIIVGITMLFGGCGSNTKEISDTLVEAEITDLDKSNDICYADLIPDPAEYFKSATIEVTDPDGGKVYSLSLTGYTKKEYDKYVEACIRKGFCDISYRTNEENSIAYGAYTEDGGYWIQADIDTYNNVLYIICQTSKNYRKEVNE